MQIQQNCEMKKTSKVINNHSEDVGRSIYHKKGPLIRAEFANYMEKNVDSPSKKIKLADEVDKEKEKRMQVMDEADAQTRKINAKAYLEAEKEKRDASLPTGRRRRLNAIDKRFLQDLIFEEIFQSSKQDFPQGKLQ